MTMLSKGSKGSEVLALQKNLIQLSLIVDSEAIRQIGYWNINNPADAVYGEKTQESVRIFQLHLRLSRKDGVADDQTINALQAISVGNGISNTDAVKALQEKLSQLSLNTCTVLRQKLQSNPGQKGTFGPASRAALEEFQNTKSIAQPKGNLGPTTYRALFIASSSNTVSNMTTQASGQSIGSPATTTAELPFNFTAPNLGGSSYTTANQFTKSGLRGQCTWYACGRIREIKNIDLVFRENSKPVYSGRNPQEWSRKLGLVIRSSPISRCIAINTRLPSDTGHVAFVEYVDEPNGLTYFTEANTYTQLQYCGLMVMRTNDCKDLGRYINGKFVRHQLWTNHPTRFNVFLYI